MYVHSLTHLVRYIICCLGSMASNLYPWYITYFTVKHVRMYTNVYVHICTCIYASMPACSYVQYVGMYICLHVCTYVPFSLAVLPKGKIGSRTGGSLIES